MKLLYSGSSFCDQQVLKRLLVVADEIGFMDRPSVTFKKWGTVGHDSFARRIDSSGSPVKFSAFKPPSGPGQFLYAPYIEADINNPEFASVVLEGFRNSDSFASKYVQFEANYGTGKGKEIVKALRADTNLLSGPFDLEMDAPHMFDVSTPDRRRLTFKMVLIEASINVTSTLIVAEGTGAIPVSEDPNITKLLSLRTTDSSYVGGTSKIAPFIGLDIAKAVIPDAMLEHLSVPQILQYREKSKDAYAAWSTEVDRVSAKISSSNIGNLNDEIARIVASELKPKIVAFKVEMCSIRDDLFADLIKKIATWEMPSLSLAYLASMGFAGSVALFASALAPAIPVVVDYYKKKRDIERRNAMSYLIQLTPDT